MGCKQSSVVEERREPVNYVESCVRTTLSEATCRAIEAAQLMCVPPANPIPLALPGDIAPMVRKVAGFPFVKKRPRKFQQAMDRAVTKTIAYSLDEMRAAARQMDVKKNCRELWINDNESAISDDFATRGRQNVRKYLAQILREQIVNEEVMERYQKVLSAYKKIPGVSKKKAPIIDLPAYLEDLTLDVFFGLVAQEEVRLRQDSTMHVGSLKLYTSEEYQRHVTKLREKQLGGPEKAAEVARRVAALQRQRDGEDDFGDDVSTVGGDSGDVSPVEAEPGENDQYGEPGSYQSLAYRR